MMVKKDVLLRRTNIKKVKSSSNETGPFESQMLNVFDKLVTYCLDFKWFGFHISDPFWNSYQLETSLFFIIPNPVQISDSQLTLTPFKHFSYVCFKILNQKPCVLLFRRNLVRPRASWSDLSVKSSSISHLGIVIKV